MALMGPGGNSNCRGSFMGLKVCGQVFNLGTILGKRTERMEWRQFEICDISKI